MATLIAEDYDCTIEDGYHMAWLSDLYGLHEFPDRDDCPVLESITSLDSREVRMIFRDLAAVKHSEVLPPKGDKPKKS